MPRKAKEKVNKLNNKENTIIDVIEKKTKTAKNSVSKTSTKINIKESAGNQVEIKTKKNTRTTRSTSTAPKSKAVKKSTSRKSSTVSKASNTRLNKKSKTNELPAITTEYYDLPFRYNQTIVKILAQTPNTLFIYWDISDEDRQSYLERYGTNFFEATKPYLMITNETMHYTFEVEINDFANSWYLHINDANCEYKVELGRKFIVNSNHDDYIGSSPSLDNANNAKTFEPYHIDDYLYITSSNKIEAPNDHILFDRLGNSVFFRNVKTNVTNEQDISSLSFLRKIGKVYNIYDLYKEIYHDELISDEFELNLPSSSTSTFK